MTTDKLDQERDLAADLALCEATALGPWEVAVDGFGDPCVINETVLIASELLTADAKMIAESRQGWPIAIRRAMAAEEKWAKLRSIVVTNATGGRGEDINDYDIIRNIMDDIDAEVNASE